MSDLSALRGKYNKFLRRCKAMHLKMQENYCFFDQKINYSEKSTNRRNLSGVQKGGESKDAKMCLSYLAPSSHTRETRARVNGCRQSHARGS